jgi:xanthine dehydrogenase accessory factor
MNELKSILATWAASEAKGHSGVLATVVDVKGSAYRRPGARMLMTSDGGRVGTISGGCLEGDVAKKSWWWTESGRPVVRVYDTTSDDETVWEFGLGCNGVVRVLLERLDTPEAKSAMAFLNLCRLERARGVMATVISSPGPEVARVGDRWFLGPNGDTEGNVNDLMVRDWIEAEADAALLERRSRLLTVPHSLGNIDVFVEVISPPVPLLIFGGGPDAMPVVRMAKELGWHVSVVDSRPSHAQVRRFPDADAVVLTRHDYPLEGVVIEPDSVAVVMNHNYPLDRSVLGRLMKHRLAFIGRLGPRMRTERIFEDLNLPMAADRIHAPIGLDIGADTPESIALSIVAEIQAVLAGRTGQMLRNLKQDTEAVAEPSEVISLCA